MSYSSKDTQIARRIVGDLKEQHVPIWFDELELKVGDSLRKKIQAGMQESNWLLVVLSKNSVESPWVQQELNAAFEIEMERQEVFILPALMDDCEIPPFLKDKIFADFRKSYDVGLCAILDRVQGEDSKQSSSEPSHEVVELGKQPHVIEQKSRRMKLLFGSLAGLATVVLIGLLLAQVFFFQNHSPPEYPRVVPGTEWSLTAIITGLIIAFSYLLDWLVGKHEKEKRKYMIINWWARLDDLNCDEAIRLANIFWNDIFDKIYGRRHFSLRCFGISCCVSLLSVLTLTAIAASIGVLDYRSDQARLFDILIIGIVGGTWIYYISLIETRLMLRQATQTTPLLLPVLLVVDFLLSSTVYILVTGGWGQVLVWLGRIGETESAPLSTILKVAVIWSRENVDANIMFYACALSTSVIFYIYCLSTLFFKFVKLSKTRIMIVLEKLEDSDHLFRALGAFLVAVVVFVKAVIEICQHN